jgi:hypothetical protein
VSLAYATLLNNLRKYTPTIPVGVGASFGVDVGFVHLTPFVENEFTVMGNPVIGAVRMVNSAPPYTLLLNSLPGHALWVNRENLKTKNIIVRKVFSETLV